MGSLTDKYQQLRKETEEKQQIEQEMQKQEAYYGNIINRTKFVCKEHWKTNVYEDISNASVYKSTLLSKFDPQRQALFQEATKLGSYIKTKWADGSIHVGGHKRYFSRKYEVLGGLMDDIRKMVAQKAAYREMQEYFRLISNAAVGASSYVELKHSNRSIVLFRDGDVLDRGQYIEKMSIKELEDFLAEAVNRINK